MRSTRQRSKPVILNLKKTEFGYEVIGEKEPEKIAAPKASVSKAEKVSSPNSLAITKVFQQGRR